MKKSFNHLRFIRRMISFSPRQFEGEKRSADFLVSWLKKNKISYDQQKFNVKIPKIKKATLKVNGEPVSCDGASMVSGETKNGEYIISNSLVMPDQNISLNKFCISYNPKCKIISNNNYYFTPTVSIAFKDLKKIIKAKNVCGKVEVEAIDHRAINILVGNKKNPKNICLAHYDSIKSGAIDNASGVSLMMGVICSDYEILQDTLFVFSASTELSYNKPVYYGYGFRVFEKKYFKQLENAQKIIIIDCIGYGETKIISDRELIKLASSMNNTDKWFDKIVVLAGNLDLLMTIYHSSLDDGRYLKEKFLKKDRDLFIEQLN